jgi:hypothetical protein
VGCRSACDEVLGVERGGAAVETLSNVEAWKGCAELRQTCFTSLQRKGCKVLLPPACDLGCCLCAGVLL